jgi:uncharacterized GH25 family protein/ketosteroid isomerase-like protein
MRFRVRTLGSGRCLRRRILSVTIVATTAVLVGFSIAEAHDFWLIPDPFRVASGAEVEIYGQTSSKFPTSEAAVTPDRVADARILGATATERIGDLSRRGTSLVLRHRPEGAGQRVVAVRLRPRSVRESAASFRRYLELEGAPEALARVESEELLRGRDSVTRRYAKYAKTLVEVGTGAAAFSRLAEHPLEFIPERDPASLRPGDTLVLRLLYHGQPLGNARVHAGSVPAANGRPQLAAASASSDLHLTSEGDGRVRVPVTTGGLWNVRTLHVVQADPGSGADWDTHWATFVFVADAPGRNRTAGGTAMASDSAAIVAVVERYHEALARGDSATALSLLAPDAVILESGGLETRAEYRSHHLPGDIAFSRAVRRERGPIRVVVQGDVAWVSSTSTSQGEYGGRAINSTGAELMVLTRESGDWRIRAIHWSSRAIRPAR